jgi:hypothetical protein
MADWRYSFSNSLLQHQVEVSGHFRASKKEPGYPLGRDLEGPGSRCGGCGKEKYLLILPRIYPWFISNPYSSHYSNWVVPVPNFNCVPTAKSQHLFAVKHVFQNWRLVVVFRLGICSLFLHSYGHRIYDFITRFFCTNELVMGMQLPCLSMSPKFIFGFRFWYWSAVQLGDCFNYHITGWWKTIFFRLCRQVGEIEISITHFDHCISAGWIGIAQPV